MATWRNERKFRASVRSRNIFLLYILLLKLFKELMLYLRLKYI